MLFKTISITLPEKMIQGIDEMLLNSQFASRSDYFRYLARLWQLQGDIGIIRSAHLLGGTTTNSAGVVPREILEEPEDEFANVDCEYGIPAKVVERIIEISKSQT